MAQHDKPKYLKGTDDKTAESVDLSRRRFLTIGLGIAVASAAAAASPVIVNMWKFNNLLKSFDESGQLADGQAEKTNDIESLPPGFILPEDERAGNALLMSDIASYNFSKGYEINEFQSIFGDFLSKLPNGTDIRIMVPDGYPDDFLMLLRSNFPRLKFSIYKMPPVQTGFSYPQDVVFPTGRVDENGRFVIIGNTFDPDIYKRIMQFNPGFKDSEKAELGASHFTDEYLAHRYPSNFNIKHVPLPCVGGDMQITRLPNGKTGAIVGSANLANFISSVDGMAYMRMRIEDFDNAIETMKRVYKDSLGIDDLIILDFDFIRETVKKTGRALRKDYQDNYFFHSDMVVKTMTRSDGKAVAFISDMEGEKEYSRADDVKYLQRVQQQFYDAGYDVEIMPCARTATLNYVNVVVLNRDGKKIVYVPQYGHRFDREAMEAYEKHGFEAVPVSFTGQVDSLQNEGGNINNFGGLHCSVASLM